MDIVPYEPAHLDTLVPGSHDALNKISLELEPGWENLAVSVRDEGRTLCVVGIAKLQTTAHVWAVMSDELREKPIALCRMAKASLPAIKELPGIEMVSIDVDLEFTEARRWAEWLGFQAVKHNPRWPGVERVMIWR